MRLICPNCSAQYEVPADVISAEGRDVQCSNCQETWFQTHPDTEAQIDVAQTLNEHFAQTEPDAAPESPPSDAVPDPDLIDDEFEHALDQQLDEILEDDPEIAPARAITRERSKREIDPSVADILREEAQREREHRAAETFEHQDEFALDANEATTDPQPKKSGDIDPKIDDLDEMYTGKASDTPASRGDQLPDIEEINSTLQQDKKLSGTEEPETQAQKNAAGRRGFHAAILILLIAVVVYVYVDLITANVPQLAPYLDAYVAQIEQWRTVLLDQTSGFLTWLQSQADQTRARNS